MRDMSREATAWRLADYVGRVVTFLVRPSLTLWTFRNATEVRMPPLLSVEEVATELGTPVRFVRRLIQERRIPFHKIGKYVRIHRADLEMFVAASRHEAVRISSVSGTMSP
jgi:excisionase family DNA binding protein